MYQTLYPPVFGQRPIQFGDVAILQFDYIPYGDEISMRYMFASEEYPNPNDRDNDVDLTDGSQPYDLMGIFIETPGYTLLVCPQRLKKQPFLGLSGVPFRAAFASSTHCPRGRGTINRRFRLVTVTPRRILFIRETVFS